MKPVPNLNLLRSMLEASRKATAIINQLKPVKP